MKTRRALLCLALACLAPAVPAAGPPRPFDATTPGELARHYAGRAYVLAFWSLECGHCQAELAGFARLLRANPGLPLELVAADPPEAAAAVAERLAALGLDPGRHWSFADSVQERVRFAVDRRWRGELVRWRRVRRVRGRSALPRDRCERGHRDGRRALQGRDSPRARRRWCDR